MNNFEKLIEYIINEDEAKAKALFHKIVVQKSRDIYESLIEDENDGMEAGDGADSFGDEISDHEDVISGDEEGMDSEAGDDEFADDDAAFGDEGDDEFGAEGGEEGLEDRVMDLEDAIDELKAEFDSIMGDEAGDGDADDFGGEPDGDADDEFDDDLDSEEGEEEVGDSDEEVGTDELGDEVEPEGESKFGEASIYGEGFEKGKKGVNPFAKKNDSSKADKPAKKDKKDEDVKEERKSPAELMREYVEKVTAVKPSEGDAVGAGGTKTSVNTKSTQISGKNDMGGTSANIARGGNSETMPTGPKGPSNAYSKGEKKMGQDKYENSPAANTKGYKDKKSAVTKQGEGVNDKSIEPGGKPGFKG